MTRTREGDCSAKEVKRHKEHCGGLVQPSTSTELSVKAEAGGQTWDVEQQLRTHCALTAVPSWSEAAAIEVHTPKLALPPRISGCSL